MGVWLQQTALQPREGAHCSAPWSLGRNQGDSPPLPPPPTISSRVSGRPRTEAGALSVLRPGRGQARQQRGPGARYLCGRLRLLRQWGLLGGSHRQFKSRAGHPAAEGDRKKRRRGGERGARLAGFLSSGPGRITSSLQPSTEPQEPPGRRAGAGAQDGGEDSSDVPGLRPSFAYT